jgi:hypothetical protein
MFVRPCAFSLLALLLAHGCSDVEPGHQAKLKYTATGSSPELLALYEPWFGHPQHISVGYNSHDPDTLRRQIKQAKAMGISAFVIDWYGDRDPFNTRTYALMQEEAAKAKFHVAMMYDETDNEDGATDVALSEFRAFRDTYLAAGAAGSQAYLTYQGRPVIFIFPKAGHTDWSRIHAEVATWKPAPLLINENDPGKQADAFDGFYAWIQPGKDGWSADGSNWGEQYLGDFYQTMLSKYPDKIVVGGVWSSFDDSKASWGLNRHISARCGQTFKDTMNDWRKFFSPDAPLPFLMVETWNDYEEGTAVERGIPSCNGNSGSSIAKAAESSRR